MDAKALQAGLEVLGANAAHIAVWSRTTLKSRSQRVVQRRMPDDAAATAQQLFAVLRAFDAEGVRLIWVETPPDTPEWEGVRDRSSAPRRPERDQSPEASTFWKKPRADAMQNGGTRVP